MRVLYSPFFILLNFIFIIKIFYKYIGKFLVLTNKIMEYSHRKNF